MVKVHFYLLAPTVHQGKTLAKLKMAAVPAVDQIVYLDVGRYRVKQVEWFMTKRSVESVCINVVQA